MDSNNDADKVTWCKAYNNELTSLIEIGKALTSRLDVHEVLQLLMKQVERLIKPKVWSLLLVDETSGELVFEVAVSPVAERLKEIRLNKGEGIAGWVALHGKPLLLSDAHKDERFASHIDKKMSFSTNSIVCVPLIIKERIIGVIELINSYDELTFDDNDLAILTAIADFAAIALENARNFDRINELVITDDLTGLYNSRYFGQLLDNEIERAMRYHTELSLVFLDLDHLKKINDAHGHLVGSRMLSELGRLIQENIRSSDKAARYGGDEYAIILPQTNGEQAIVLANKLLALMRSSEFYSDDSKPIQLTASFGIANFPQDAETRVELIRALDTAMYRAKQAGRGVVRSFA
ncbi:MAG: sensor domain-containing diguanylate cyclase [Oryzomonas sp.]|uniref:GGDEF domain-containing protein n=1 Tax=Oryzomonas sp. TaxID=2855186 RepID=UPI0028478E0A|nr:sensor domain-containing diguanylate cyclase [Oryzomonas sp.]MDR3580483.1 sensor domain-containing diguanylate cyclase [Oryzomonas sp.]